MADEQIQEPRVRNDQICEELGLPKFQKDEQRQSRGMSNAEYYTASKGESWKFELMRVIDECMRYAGNRDEFLTLLRAEGYDAAWRDSRKNITYTTPDGRKCRDNKLYIEKYLKENMEAEFGDDWMVRNFTVQEEVPELHHENSYARWLHSAGVCK